MERNWIKLSDKNKDQITFFIEKWYPFTFSIIFVIVYYCSLNIKILDDKDTIINAIINFTSILVGFIGTLLALLFSLNNNPIVQFIFDNEHYNKLTKNFFIRVFQSGFALIICSLALFFRRTINNFDFFNLKIQSFKQEITVLFLVKTFWIYSLSYFGLSAYRIISIITKIAFAYNNRNKESNTDADEKLDEEEYERLKKENEMKR